MPPDFPSNRLLAGLGLLAFWSTLMLLLGAPALALTIPLGVAAFLLGRAARERCPPLFVLGARVREAVAVLAGTAAAHARVAARRSRRGARLTAAGASRAARSLHAGSRRAGVSAGRTARRAASVAGAGTAAAADALWAGSERAAASTLRVAGGGVALAAAARPPLRRASERLASLAAVMWASLGAHASRAYAGARPQAARVRTTLRARSDDALARSSALAPKLVRRLPALLPEPALARARGLSGRWPRWMERDSRRTARTQLAPISRRVGAAKDSASRRLAPVGRPRSPRGQARTTPSARSRTWQLNRAASDHRREGRLEEALACCEQALSAAARANDRRDEALTLNSLGLVHADAGELGRAAEAYERSAAILRELDEPHVLARVLANLGAVRDRQERGDDALACWREALELLDADTEEHTRLAERVAAAAG